MKRSLILIFQQMNLHLKVKNVYGKRLIIEKNHQLFLFDGVLSHTKMAAKQTVPFRNIFTYMQFGVRGKFLQETI